MPCRGETDVKTVPFGNQKKEEETFQKENDSNDYEENEDDNGSNDRQQGLKSVENNDEKIVVGNKKAKKSRAKKTNRKEKTMVDKNVESDAEGEDSVAELAQPIQLDETNKTKSKSQNIIENNRPTRGRSGGICCSSSSVQIQDSLSPLQPEVEGAVVTNDAIDSDEVDDGGDIIMPVDGELSDDFDDKENEEMNHHPSVKKSRRKKTKENQGYVDDEPYGKGSKSLVIPSKKGKYSVHQMEEDPLYASLERRTPVKAPRKKKSSPQKLEIPQSSEDGEMDEVKSMKLETNASPKKRKKKQPRMEETDEALEMQSVYESQIASIQNHPTLATEHYSGTDFSATGQPTIEVERDLLDNADEERKKNKLRLRERKMKEKEHESPNKTTSDPTELAYENAQKEIDKVLGPREKADGEGKKERKSSKSKHRDKDKSKSKEAKKKEDQTAVDESEKGNEFNHPPESLEEAKQRMHKLLDDAFSLFSQSRSSMGNKVHPSPRDSGDEKTKSPASQRSQASDSSKENVESLQHPQPEEKKHTPLFVERSHGPYDKTGLISWSPYRASDETALISLPVSQADVSPVPPQRELITTSTFSESLPTSLRPNYYTTQPGEPIVIKMQDLVEDEPTKSSFRPDGSLGREPSRFKEDPDVYSEPYYGMSSYQEIPLHTAVPGLDSNESAAYGDVQSGRDGSASQSGQKVNEGGSHIDVRAHTGPGRGGNYKNNDVLDVIKRSVQPGASPGPLVSSLRDELESLSLRRKGDGSSSSKC